MHILAKGKFHTYNRSVVSDVRVTSCSAALGKKYDFAGIAFTRSFLKTKTIGKNSILGKEWDTKLLTRVFEIMKTLEFLRF